MAMSTSKGTLPGLERLAQLSTVNINQTSSGFKGNKYSIDTKEGEVLFNLKEDGHALTFLSKGHIRGFNIDGVENTGRKVFSLRRPGVFMSDKVELYMNNTLVSIIRKEATLMKPVFSVNNAHDEPTLRIKGNAYNDINFQVQTINKTDIGSIDKNFRGILKEMFSYKDHYSVTFPVDLDVRYKLALLGACVLIDYRYHES